ncbi:endolytic transglycosylase MltG [Gordonia alkaliphila]|uniref:endolytic transglycosylase MltG n=1 Tax=Gordonia alkaliphila TaxID=1053547 RepID=UPI0031F1651D
MTDENGPERPIPGHRAEPPTRHRRRRAPGDPTTTGSIPIVRTPSDMPDPTVDYRRPERSPNPYLEIRYSQTELPQMQFGSTFTEPPAAPTKPAAPRTPVTPPAPSAAPAPTPPPAAPPQRPVAAAPPPASTAPPTAPVSTAPQAAPTFDILDEVATAPAAAAPADPFVPVPLAAEPIVPEPAVFEPLAAEPPAAEPAAPAPPIEPPDNPDWLDDAEPGPGMPARRKRGRMIFAMVAVLVLLVSVGLVGMRQLGVFDSRKDFDSTTGGAMVLVAVPEDASLREFGRLLTDAGVVGSQRAFVDAAGNQALSAGYYELPTGISATTAVDRIAGGESRVGRVVIPEGLQLDSKTGVDGKVTPGIFQMLADATSLEADGRTYGVTVEQLQTAAAQSSAAELGVPEWATSAVTKLDGDHRRIEGLIASGAWEDVDPRLDAKELLNSLITRSATRFETWGLLSANDSGLLPYDTLVVASIVEREVSQPDDYAKVARVILNRLDKGQKLEMDSTANYTAAITNIDVFGEAYTSKTEWNTYQREGLPVTPIGAVGERALAAVENPSEGNWLYFVTVDKQGTTLFAQSYERHKKNRDVACKNKFITTGCS